MPDTQAATQAAPVPVPAPRQRRGNLTLLPSAQDDYRGRIRGLKKAITAVTNVLADSEGVLAVTESVRDALQQDLDRLKAESTNIAAELANAKVEINRMAAEIKALRQENQTLRDHPPIVMQGGEPAAVAPGELLTGADAAEPAAAAAG